MVLKEESADVVLFRESVDGERSEQSRCQGFRGAEASEPRRSSGGACAA